LSDDDLAAIVLDGLAGSALPQARVVDRVVLRRANAYPIYGVGYEEALVPLLDDVAHRPRVLTFGRQGLFAHDNTHHALAMAWAAADVVRRDGGINTRAWTRALDRFASHVVED
jgi:protoporphyrinogen oxidase